MARNKVHKQRFRSKHQLLDKQKGRKVFVDRIAAREVEYVENENNKREKCQVENMQNRNEEMLSGKMNKGISFTKTSLNANRFRICNQHRNVGIVPANEAANVDIIIKSISEIIDIEGKTEKRTFSANNSNSKFSFTFTVEKDCRSQESIDIVKVSDFLLLVLDVSHDVKETIENLNAVNKEISAEESNMEFESVSTWYSNLGLCITEYTRNLISAINAQGSSNIVVLLTSTDSLSALERRKIFQIHQRYFLSVLHNSTKVMFAQKKEEFVALFRHIEQSKLRVLKWREYHPYLLVDNSTYDEPRRQLLINGYLKGAALSAKQLMHLTNFGTYQISCIKQYDVNKEMWVTVDESTVEERESLKALQVNETYDDDNDHISEGDVYFYTSAEAKSAHRVRVPAGVSEYQATWYDAEENYVINSLSDASKTDTNGNNKLNSYRENIDDNEEEELARKYETVSREHESSKKHHEADSKMMNTHSRADTKQAYEEFEPSELLHHNTMTHEYDGGYTLNDDNNYDVVDGAHHMSEDCQTERTIETELEFLRAEEVIREDRMSEEERLLELQRLEELEEDNAGSVDVVATPIDIPARQRFAKYRGLKSFRTSIWDTNENLPPPYAYIYKLQGFTRIRSIAVNALSTNPVRINSYVQITLENVPRSVYTQQCTKILIASAQLEHEQKWSVVHSQIQRASELEDQPIKSKTPMFVHIGFRKYYVCPLFSEITPDNRSKFIRVLQSNQQFCMASFYGPISFNPCPILFYEVPSLEEQDNNCHLRLAAFGTVVSPNPDLLILKKTTLTGRVAVIHKKQIVVKYMFFNESDVRWFSPVDLYTKFGRRGKIVKPVGTHGLFKAALNDQVMQHDVICMDLYKRVFPKWTTIPYSLTENKQHCEAVEHASTDESNEM